MNISHATRNKLESIAETIAQANAPIYFDFSRTTINECWERAGRYRKTTIDFIKEGWEMDKVASFMFFDEVSQTVKDYTITARKNYSRWTWFVILLCNANHLSYQATKKAIKLI